MVAAKSLHVDVVVVGGGPAGSSTAIYLAQAGLQVRLFERESFPRFRIGESLLPLNMPIFQELGIADKLDQKFIRKYGATFLDRYGGRSSRIRFCDGLNKEFPYAYQVERSEFDTVLIKQAMELGVEVDLGVAVREVLFDGKQAVGVRVNSQGKKFDVHCSFVVDASGHSSLIGRQLGLKIKSDLKTRAAFFSHFENVTRPEGEASGDIRIVPLRYGWFWIIPFLGSTTSVGVVVNDDYLTNQKGDTENRFWNAVSDTPYVKELLDGTSQKFPIKSIGNYSYGMKTYAGDGYVMIGDSNAFLDPVFSSGVFLAMKAAQLASRTIIKCFREQDYSAGRFRAYETHIRFAQKIFLRIIRGWYNPAFLDLFFFETNVLGVRRALITALAADVFNPRYKWSLIFRIELMHWLARRHAVNLRKRKGGRSIIQQLPV